MAFRKFARACGLKALGRGAQLPRPGNDGQGAVLRRPPVTFLSSALCLGAYLALCYSPAEVGGNIDASGLPNLLTTETGLFSSALHDESPAGPGDLMSSRVDGPASSFIGFRGAGQSVSTTAPATIRTQAAKGGNDAPPGLHAWQKAELTWYDGYKLTASGERYDRDSRTVAVMYRSGTRRPRLPFGTVIEIRTVDAKGRVLSTSRARVNNTGSHKPRGAGWWLDGTPTVFASHAPLKKGRLIVEFRIVEDVRG